MRYWLFKSEPGTWSWDDQVKEGDKGAGWDGVRNHQASNNMKAIKIGDQGFFYHSVNEKQVVGIVEVVAEYHPDDTDASGRFGMVDVKAARPITRPVTLRRSRRMSDWLILAWCANPASPWYWSPKNSGI